jgi:hypothetical protein
MLFWALAMRVDHSATVCNRLPRGFDHVATSAAGHPCFHELVIVAAVLSSASE